MELEFSPVTPINFGDKRPVKIGVKAKIVADVMTSYTIKVEACNNAFDTTPTWEDITASYLAEGFHEFTNRVKQADKSWGISIRLNIRKNASSDSVEVQEFYMYYV
jgi:hypothetical protein